MHDKQVCSKQASDFHVQPDWSLGIIITWSNIYIIALIMILDSEKHWQWDPLQPIGFRQFWISLWWNDCGCAKQWTYGCFHHSVKKKIWCFNLISSPTLNTRPITTKMSVLAGGLRPTHWLSVTCRVTNIYFWTEKSQNMRRKKKPHKTHCYRSNVAADA